MQVAQASFSVVMLDISVCIYFVCADCQVIRNVKLLCKMIRRLHSAFD